MLVTFGRLGDGDGGDLLTPEGMPDGVSANSLAETTLRAAQCALEIVRTMNEGAGDDAPKLHIGVGAGHLSVPACWQPL